MTGFSRWLLQSQVLYSHAKWLRSLTVPLTLMTLPPGTIGSSEVAVVGLLCNVITFFLPFVVSLYVATQQRILDYLLVGFPIESKMSFGVGCALIILVSSSISGLIFVFKDNWTILLPTADAYPRMDENVGRVFGDIIPFAALQFFLSGACHALQACVDTQGTLRGTVLPIICGNWVVGGVLICIVVLGIGSDRQTQILWICLVIGEAVKFLILLYFVIKFDWAEQSRILILREDQEEAELGLALLDCDTPKLASSLQGLSHSTYLTLSSIS